MSEAASETRRYGLTLTKVPREARDEFRRLSRPQSYKEVRPGAVGERVAYSVEMTTAEYERAQRVAADPASNLMVVEPVHFSPWPQVPDSSILHYLALDGVWDQGWKGAGVDLGLLDSGISATVRDMVFAGRVKAASSFVGLDPWNDPSGHGTFSAGLAFPPSAQVVNGQVGDAEGTFEDDVASGIYWAVDTAGVDVLAPITQSIPGSTMLQDATAHAIAQNVLVVAPAGNGGADYLGDGENIKSYPAAYPGVLAISSYDPRTDARAASSNYGSHIFAASPGMATTSYARDGSLEYREDGGTSAAAPVAANVAASIMSEVGAPGTVKSYLAEHARRTGAGGLHEGSGVLQGSPVVNAIRISQPEGENLDGSLTGSQEGCMV